MVMLSSLPSTEANPGGKLEDTGQEEETEGGQEEKNNVLHQWEVHTRLVKGVMASLWTPFLSFHFSSLSLPAFFYFLLSCLFQTRFLASPHCFY